MPFLAQTQSDFTKNLEQIKNNSFEGIILNDSLVAKFLMEYQHEAIERGINLEVKFKTLYWILIEPESNVPSEFKEFELSKVDRSRKMILLSRSCLLDRYILKATLYRELSHYFGIPYNLESLEIMRVEKPKAYSYAWFDDPMISEYVNDDLFNELKKYMK